jgi:transcriptional regulator with XRE-family HTH domain
MAERGITQRKLAFLLLVSPGTVSGWLRGARPYDRTVTLLSDKLGLRREWLTRGDGEPYPKNYRPTPEGDEKFAHVLIDISARADLFEDIEREYERIIAETDKRAAEYRERLRQLRIRFYRRNRAAAQAQLETSLPVRKFSLHNSGNPVTSQAMVSKSLRDLLDKVRAFTRRAGDKKALASTIGVSQQQLSDWLSKSQKAYKPSGENTLQLLAWVQAKEAQQKQNPEGALTPPGRVTQQRKSKHEKPRSGQQKPSRNKPTKAIGKKRPRQRKSRN